MATEFIITDFEDGSDKFDVSVYGLSGGGEFKAAGSDTEAGYLVDLSLLGGSGTVLIQGLLEADITSADLIL